MAKKPIIPIEIDDTKFRAFYELFQKYEEDVEKMPEAVKKLNDAINANGKAHLVAATSAAKAMQPGADSSAAVAQSLKDATAATKALATETKKTDALMASFATRSTTAAKSLFEAGASLTGIKKVLSSFGPAGDIAALGLGVAFGAGALALKSAGATSNTAQAAFGANLGYGAYQNATSALSPFMPNPGAMLQNVAAAQWNPQMTGKLSYFGVNGSQSSASALATILKTAGNVYRTTQNNQMPAVVFGEAIAGINDTTLMSWANQSPADQKRAIAQMLDPKRAAKQNVVGDVISKNQKLVVSWNASMNTASASFAKALAPMNPVVTKFGDGVAGFSSAVNKLVQAVVGPSAPGTPGGPGGPPLTSSNSQNATGWNGIKSRLPTAFGGLGNGPGGGGGWKFSPGFMPQNAIMAQFERAGYSKNFAAAMAAQAFSESSFNGSASSFDKKTGWHKGLFQWSATRRAQILKGAGIDVWKDFNTQDQVKAAIWELQHTQKSAAAKINAAKTQFGAGVAADRYYEVSGDNLVGQFVRGSQTQTYAELGPGKSHAGTSPEIVALLKRLADQKIVKPVHVHVTNSTAARVAVSANAAAYG